MRLPFNGYYPTTQKFNDPCCRASYAKFGMQGHNGIDYALPTGTVVVAPHSGKVLEAGFSPNGYGNYVKIDDGSQGSVLAHLQSITVGVGQQVSEGQQIGKSNNTGNSSGPHLHWGYYRNPRNRSNGFDGFVDQTPYLSQPVNQGGSMGNIDGSTQSRDAMRVINSEVKGWNFDATHKGEYDAREMAAWNGREWTQHILQAWAEGAPFRQARIQKMRDYDVLVEQLKNSKTKAEYEAVAAQAKASAERVAELEKQVKENPDTVLIDEGKNWIQKLIARFTGGK